MKNLYKLMAVMLAGFAGGFISPILYSFYSKTAIPSASDAIAIANTYIVFTTIIFVGFTVVLGLAGYVFTQQFSTTKENQENILFSELKSKIANDDDIAMEIFKAVLNNSDVIRDFSKRVEEKVQERVDDLMNEINSSAQEERDVATRRHESIQSISNKITGKRNGSGDQGVDHASDE